MCIIFNALRQRLFQRNSTILSLQQNYGRERVDLTRQIQTMQEELRVERRQNRELRGRCRTISTTLSQSDTVCDQACRKASDETADQSSTDSCDSQNEIACTELQSEQNIEATTLRYRRLGRAALVNSLKVNPQKDTSPPHAVIESVENWSGSDQRKRAKRSCRRGAPADPSNTTTSE